MKILDYINNHNNKFIITVLIVMGITGGFSTLSYEVEWEGKLLFSSYGLVVGLLLGLVFSKIINCWITNSERKRKAIWIFILLGIAPMFWAFFDFEEHILSKKGLVIMVILDAISLTLLCIMFWNQKRKLISPLLTATLWQLVCLYWFICITWKDMNYWD